MARPLTQTEREAAALALGIVMYSEMQDMLPDTPTLPELAEMYYGSPDAQAKMGLPEYLAGGAYFRSRRDEFQQALGNLFSMMEQLRNPS